MVRCKNPNVPLEEETLPEEMGPRYSEETEYNTMESNEETEVIQPLEMYFSPTEYTKPYKISAKCYIHQVVKLFEVHLHKDELTWFKEHPQFRHFFHMHTESNHRLMGMWMLFLRTARLQKKKECWFIVNGVPIRYSLREFGLISGLDCQQYPKQYLNNCERLGSMSFVTKYFKAGSVVTYADVEEKLMSMTKKSFSTARLKMAILYFLSSIIIAKRKTGKNAPSVEQFFLRAVDDLELCKTFPWGRLAFDENMKDISHLMDHFGGVVGPATIFTSFVMPLELLAFETIPVLMNKYREPVRDADPECPRMCKMKFRASTMKGIPLSEVNETLGENKNIQSIMVPNPDEEVLLARIMDDEDGWNDVDDAAADGWRKRLIDEGRPIWFEKLYNEDVANQKIKANPDMASTSARVPQRDTSQGYVVAKKVKKNGLVEMINGLKKTMGDGFKEIHQKLELLDTRVKPLEEYVNFQRKKETFWCDILNEEENEMEEAGEKENEMEEAGEKEMEEAGEEENEIEEGGEDGGKMLKTYERKRRAKELEGEVVMTKQKKKVAVRSPVVTRQKNKEKV